MNWFKDSRDYQILFLSLFLCLGIANRDWTLRWELLLSVFLSCLLTQILLSSYQELITNNNQQLYFFKYKYNWLEYLKTNLNISSWKSALITALGLSLLLRANEPYTMALAGCLAISSKFLFKVNNKHFFNPANFGIIVAITLTKDAWVSPGQWGSDWWYLLLFMGTGMMILSQVSRWETTAVFLLTYSGLEAIKNYYLGWDLAVLEHQLMSGSLLVFAFFMLTDPRSIPNARISRIIWAFVIALTSVILKDFFYVNNAIFWSLFMMSPLTLWFDKKWQMSRFMWNYKGS
jgi:Na+-transporting NADH:ubiquinone oxidoreductase subunit NqrB